MTAPLFLADRGALDSAAPGELVRVGGSEGHHAVSVLRLALGESVLIGDGAGIRAQAEVVELERSVLVARVLSVETEPPPEPSFVLVQALAKGDRDEQAVEAATELGVDAVVPWQAARNVVQWKAERAVRGQRRWEAVVVAATKQSRRMRVPQVRPLARTAEIVDLVRSAALAVILHEDATAPLAGVTLPERGEVVVVVGPEGGIAPAELAALEDAGGRVLRLGSTVLRSSSAGPAALAVLNAAGRWR